MARFQFGDLYWFFSPNRQIKNLAKISHYTVLYPCIWLPHLMWLPVGMDLCAETQYGAIIIYYYYIQGNLFVHGLTCLLLRHLRGYMVQPDIWGYQWISSTGLLRVPVSGYLLCLNWPTGGLSRNLIASKGRMGLIYWCLGDQISSN